MWKKRSLEPEILDLDSSHYTIEEYNDCLHKLGYIGKWLGDQATLDALLRLPQKPNSILDVGCGGGFLAMKLAELFPEAQIVGIDINPLAIDFAEKRKRSLEDPPANLSFKLINEPELNQPDNSYDVVTANLVCHHMDDKGLVEFLMAAKKIARQKVFINDLQRNPAAYAIFKMISPLFFRNRLIHHDGLLSIRKSFRKKDWIQYMQQAGVPNQKWRISKKWAFRWLVEIDCL